MTVHSRWLVPNCFLRPFPFPLIFVIRHQCLLGLHSAGQPATEVSTLAGSGVIVISDE